MDSRTYYYARVSSKEQNLDRQIAAFKALGATDREIITDKESGKDLERAGYQALKNAMLRRGDTLIVKSLDRLSRNKADFDEMIDRADTLESMDYMFQKTDYLLVMSDLIKGMVERVR